MAVLIYILFTKFNHILFSIRKTVTGVAYINFSIFYKRNVYSS